MDTFDPTAEPLRAIRDLICFCELDDIACSTEGAEALDSAREAFTALRKLFGDQRLAEAIADGPMIEPDIASVPALIKALQMASGALRSMEHLSLVDPQAPIQFIGKWAHFGTVTIPDILDRASVALEGAAP